MKILHVTYHQGCEKSLDFVAKSLKLDLTTQIANWNYNIGHNRANDIWNRHKDFYEKFDVIITSDTGPLSRIFLQNSFKKLIIWVCNRFDYTDQATNDCGFPDQEYYDLFRSAIKNKNKNVKIFSYTDFEHEYARKYKNMNWGEESIKPICEPENTENFRSAIPEYLNKKEIFFIPPYHNDTILLNLQEKCNELGFGAYNGRYNGVQDLVPFKGIVHIPYAWSNLALFENWAVGNVYLIPSKDFLIKLSKQPNFFWSPPFDKDLLKFSEWYLPEHKNLFLYFDDWAHLKYIVEHPQLIEQKKQLIKKFSNDHVTSTLEKWQNAVYHW